MKNPRRLSLFFALSAFLAAALTARAIATFPATVENRTSVAVEITTVRVQRDLGKPSTTNEVKVTIQPGQQARVMLMGGSFGTGSSFTKQVTIAQAPTPAGQPAVKIIAPPLVLDKDFPTTGDCVVNIDPKTGHFTFHSAPPKPKPAPPSPDIT
jgi:hypothetical protein